jgi:hypothetical protein
VWLGEEDLRFGEGEEGGDEDDGEAGGEAAEEDVVLRLRVVEQPHQKLLGVVHVSLADCMHR